MTSALFDIAQVGNALYAGVAVSMYTVKSNAAQHSGSTPIITSGAHWF